MAIPAVCFPPPFEAPLAVVPSFNWNLLPGGVSNVFWHAVSPSNSLVVTWENSPVNRNVNCITNFQAEFFTDGRFAYRYQDHAVDYAPVFPFDWDGDGLENTIDPEPLVAGPDAHGTNVEWYNIVCSNVYEAAVSGEPLAMPALEGTISGPRDLAPPGIELVPRTSDVNTNAYYFVAVVVSRGPAPIYFTADGESRLGNPVVIARAGETNHVPLLIGANYCISSSVPVTVVAPDDAVFSVHSSGGVPMLLGAVPYQQGNVPTLIYPAVLDYVDIGGICSPVQDYWMSLGGELSWSDGCCMRLLGDNNPVYLGYEKDKRKTITGAGIEDIVIHIPRTPLVDGDSLARSKFDRHVFAVCNDVVYDACVGPSLGTHSI